MTAASTSDARKRRDEGALTAVQDQQAGLVTALRELVDEWEQPADPAAIELRTPVDLGRKNGIDMGVDAVLADLRAILDAHPTPAESSEQPDENREVVALRAAVERHGPCECNIGPGTDGPDEFCPRHGRSYTDLRDIGAREINDLHRELDEARTRLADMTAALTSDAAVEAAAAVIFETTYPGHVWGKPISGFSDNFLAVARAALQAAVEHAATHPDRTDS